MSGEATSGLATSDKWGILPILSSYPSFNNIPDEESENLKRRLFTKS